MPRNHIPGASTLRNPKRITNKTRLKIVRGNVDGHDLLIPDEDEEKHRLTNLVAGVDAEDANEHHLQEVLTAAHRVQAAATKKVEEKPLVYIPTPDSTGLADDWETLYPANVWKDPATFVCTSTTVEESVRDGLANGFSYFMDERDKEWLDKNNEEARGEGTSAAGAISASGTRTSARSAKAKGKEPDLNQPVVISEDEFELVMGIFEKVTHEKTEFLHHSLETGMAFPAFSEYQDTFAAPLPPALFATFSVPTWIPQPQHLLRLARTVYPYWKERRIERAGHRIIPTLNFDESDTLNESYICFRRREIKAVRKTRQAQVSSSEKLIRLQGDFAYTLDLARHVLERETHKRDQAIEAQRIWERRMALSDLKRKFPAAFSDKADEALLFDQERQPKRQEPSRLGVKIPPNPTNLMPLRPEPIIKPRERINKVRELQDAYLGRRKEEDKIWEDVVDNPQQTPYAPYASKLFKFIPPASAPSYPSDAGSDKTADSDDERSALQRAIRIRYARGGRVVVDRREFGPPRKIAKLPRSSLFGGPVEDENTPEDPEEAERRRRLEERWRFDADDAPSPPTAEEDSRVLVDECAPKYLMTRMTLFTEKDQNDVSTDGVLYLPTSDGRQLGVLPYRIGQMGPRPMRPPPPQMMQPGMIPPNAQVVPQGIPVSMPLPLKKMPPPSAIPQQMRISSNGGMRPPGLPSPSLQAPASGSQQSPPVPVTLPTTQHAPATAATSGGWAAIAMPHVDMVKPAEPTLLPSGAAVANAVATPEASSTPTPQEAPAPTAVPARPKSTNQVPAMTIPNGFHHVNPVNQVSAAQAAFNYQQQLQNGQSVIDMQQKLKAMFAPQTQANAMQAAQLVQAQGNRAFAQTFITANGTPQGLAMPATGNMKIPAGVRQLQWPMGVGMQRPGSAAMVGVDGVSATPSPNPGVANGNAAHLIPVRSPSTNGMRPAMRMPSGGHPMGQAHAHLVGHGGAVNVGGGVPNIAQSQSPPRHSMTPTMGMASPPMQHQQPVGNQNGY